MGAQANARSNFNLKSVVVPVAALANAADLAEQAIWVPKQGCKVHHVEFISNGTSTGTDGSNTSIFTVKKGVAGTTFATYTKDSEYVNNTVYALTVTAADAELTAGQIVTLTITNGGTTSDSPAGYLVITYSTDGLVSS